MEGTVRLRKTILLALIGVALASSLLGVLPSGDWAGLLLNFGTEMAGALVTYALLELVIGRREGREAKKAELIAQLGSQVEDVAIAATEELSRQGWLDDGSLEGASLYRANLQEVYLFGANLHKAFLDGANLQRAVLSETDLQEAYLSGANLQEAVLYGANLQGAFLRGANLQGAVLCGANLQGAFLDGADLQGTDLSRANLQRAILVFSEEEAKFNKDTTLPDRTKWVSDIDMARFTDPGHPFFWDGYEPYEVVKVETRLARGRR
jgi:uncharacterized protein YjbI with pentapeptide repeats